MDKYEYKVRADEIRSLIAEGEYAQAAEIADTIDWRRVKSVMMLCTISDLYKINRRYEDAKNMLLLAYERRPGGKTICYSLCELCIKTEDFVQAVNYYKEFVQVAPKDSGRYILQYKLYEAQDVGLEERIGVLEELKKRDYREKWAYELAYLYHRVGLATRCVEECDELILWFGDGKYVVKAMELKMLHQPLTAAQQEKYEHRFEPWNVPGSAGASAGEQSGWEQSAEEETGWEQAGWNQNGGEQTGWEQAAQGEMFSGTAEVQGGVQQNPDEMDIQVKTMDVGQYNTINLQAEIAAGLQEVLSGSQQSDAITRSILAPLMDSDTESLDLPEIEEVDESDLEPEAEVMESSEVFFGETADMSGLQQDAAGTDAEAADITPGDREPRETEKAPAEEPVNKTAEETVPDMTEIIVEQPRTENLGRGEEQVLTAQPPRELAGVLSQESDGQISLVVPEAEKVEKQITGQMNLGDILIEWEKAKKENEKKRKEEVRQRVLEQTGNMFTEFEASVRDGLLEQLEGERSAAGEKELEEVALEAGSQAEKELTKTEALTEYGEDAAGYEEGIPEQAGAAPEYEGESAEPENQGWDYEEDSAEYEEEASAYEEDSAEYGEEASVYEEDSAEYEEEASVYEEDPAEYEEEPLDYEQDSLEYEAEDSVYEQEIAALKKAPEYEEDPEDYGEDSLEPEEDSADSEEMTGDAQYEEEALEYEAESKEYEAESGEAEGVFSEEPGDGEGDAVHTGEADAEPEGKLTDGEEPGDADSSRKDAGAEEESGDSMAQAQTMRRDQAGKTKKQQRAERRRARQVQESAGDRKETAVSVEREKAKVRSLTREERELYGPYIQSRSAREKLVKALDSISMAAYTGNIIITGEKGMDTLTLAKNMIREVQMTDSNFSGKVAKISGDGMNAKNVADTLEKLKSGALIIHGASGMKAETVEALYKALQQERLGIIVVLEDTRKAIDRMLSTHVKLRESFTARMDVEALSNDMLVTFGKQYAREQEYSIDDLGVLALHTRIEALQTIDHSVTVAEVKEMVDEAIHHANRKTPGHFFDILFARRYDDEDMIILTEKDFV